MKNKRGISFISLLFLLTGIAGGQGVFMHPGIFVAPVRHAQHWAEDGELRLMSPGDFHLGVDLGSSFTSFAGNGNMFSQSISPVMHYQAGKRFHLQTGAVLSVYHLSSRPGQDFLPARGNGFNAYFLYAAGTYQFSQRLAMTGVVYKNIQPVNPFGFEPNSRLDFQGMSMNLDFRISDAFRLGASFNYDNRPAYAWPGQFMHTRHPFDIWPY